MTLTEAKKKLIEMLYSIKEIENIKESDSSFTCMKGSSEIKIVFLSENIIDSYNSKNLKPGPFASFQDKPFYYKQKIKYAGYVESEQGCIDILFWENNWYTVESTEKPGKCFFKSIYPDLIPYDVPGAKYINKKSLTDYITQL